MPASNFMPAQYFNGLYFIGATVPLKLIALLLVICTFSCAEPLVNNVKL